MHGVAFEEVGVDCKGIELLGNGGNIHHKVFEIQIRRDGVTMWCVQLCPWLLVVISGLRGKKELTKSLN